MERETWGLLSDDDKVANESESGGVCVGRLSIIIDSFECQPWRAMF